MYTNGGALKNEGDIVKPGKLCETLKKIASGSADEFYKGDIASSIIGDLSKKSGALTKDDLSSYSAKWASPLKTTLLNDLTLYTANAPGGGAPLALCLNMIDEYGFNPSNLESSKAALTLHQMSEMWKYCVASKTQLGDPDVNSLDEVIYY